MGACFSSSSAHLRQPAANVISITGDLYRFETPVPVSSVLLRLSQISSSVPKNYFLSDSDRLSYDDLIPAMSSDEELIADKIYFFFHHSRLNRRLSASNMAALAVKASLALNNSSKSSLKAKSHLNWRRVPSKISPFVESEQSSGRSDYYSYNNATVKSGGFDIAFKPAVLAGGLTRSSSLMKLQRYSSKRAKMASKPFRLLSLSTIHEGYEA